MHVATQEGHSEVVRILLNYGANPFLMTGAMRSALHIAVSKGYKEIVTLLGTKMKILQQAHLEGQHHQVIEQRPDPISRTQPNENGGASQLYSIPLDVSFDDTEDLFTCPITKAIMQDPVVAPDGHTYERSAIVNWLRSHGRSPVTQQPMAVSALVPNLNLKYQIETYLQKKKEEAQQQ